MLGEVFTAFVEQSPVSVMMRALMERIFRPERLDEIFETHAKVQYTRELLFSTLVNLMSLVVCGIQPSVNAAYKAKAAEMTVNRSAVYQKLNGVEPQVSAALLRETAAELGQLIQQMGGSSPPLLAGYETQLLDGNALAATEHRLKVLQTVSAAPLPGKSLGARPGLAVGGGYFSLSGRSCPGAATVPAGHRHGPSRSTLDR
jgi:hypothetical protein